LVVAAFMLDSSASAPQYVGTKTTYEPDEVVLCGKQTKSQLIIQPTLLTAISLHQRLLMIWPALIVRIWIPGRIEQVQHPACFLGALTSPPPAPESTPPPQ